MAQPLRWQDVVAQSNRGSNSLFGDAVGGIDRALGGLQNTLQAPGLQQDAQKKEYMARMGQGIGMLQDRENYEQGIKEFDQNFAQDQEQYLGNQAHDKALLDKENAHNLALEAARRKAAKEALTESRIYNEKERIRLKEEGEVDAKKKESEEEIKQRLVDRNTQAATLADSIIAEETDFFGTMDDQEEKAMRYIQGAIQSDTTGVITKEMMHSIYNDAFMGARQFLPDGTAVPFWGKRINDAQDAQEYLSEWLANPRNRDALTPNDQIGTTIEGREAAAVRDQQIHVTSKENEATRKQIEKGIIAIDAKSEEQIYEEFAAQDKNRDGSPFTPKQQEFVDRARNNQIIWEQLPHKFLIPKPLTPGQVMRETMGDVADNIKNPTASEVLTDENEKAEDKKRKYPPKTRNPYTTRPY